MQTEEAWKSDRLFAAVREIERLLPSLEQYAASVVSTLSGLEVSQRMFQRLGGMWLMHAAHQVAAPTQSSSNSRPAERLTIPQDAWSHHQLFMTSSQYRTQMFDLADGGWPSNSTKSISSAPTIVPMPSRSRLGRTLETVASSSWPGADPVMVSFPYLKLQRRDRISAIFRSRKIISWRDPEQAHWVSDAANAKLRLELCRAVEGNDLYAQICRVIALMIPIAYGEDLKRHLDMYRRQFRQPRLLYSANGSQFQLPYQVLSALWGQSGTLVASHQHGGHQGLDEVHAGEEYEVRASDVHYSLGWQDHRQNVVPLLAAMPAHMHSREKHRLLLMSLASGTVTYRLQPFCIPSHINECISETRRFLTSLQGWTSPVVRCDEAIREELESANAQFEWERINSSGTISASRSALVVHNYLGASWLETLAMNVPTVCFIPPDIHRFRPAAQPFADALIRVGILHYSGVEAARFVNSLKGDPSAWWNSSEVQEARQAFVARYANFSENWLEAWMNEFERILAE